MAAQRFLKFLLLLSLTLVVTLALAQSEGGENAADTSEQPPRLTLGSIEFLGGWPGFRLYGLRLGAQVEQFGFALEGSYNEAGIYASLAGRYYLPIPGPVPTFVNAGAGIFVDDPVFFAGVGAHIPLGLSDFRLSIEGGASRVLVFDQPQILPYASLALGYTFIFDSQALKEEKIAERQASTEGSGQGCVAGEPSASALRSSFVNRLKSRIAKARTTYAGSYRDLSYSYNITDVSISGERGRVEARYQGSATEVISGKRVSASGTINASFSWTGCSWRLEDYSY